jgi:hypothetical protein
VAELARRQKLGSRRQRRTDDGRRRRRRRWKGNSSRRSKQTLSVAREIIYFWTANNPQSLPKVHIPFHTRSPLSRLSRSLVRAQQSPRAACHPRFITFPPFHRTPHHRTPPTPTHSPACIPYPPTNQSQSQQTTPLTNPRSQSAVLQYFSNCSL